MSLMIPTSHFGKQVLTSTHRDIFWCLLPYFQGHIGRRVLIFCQRKNVVCHHLIEWNFLTNEMEIEFMQMFMCKILS